jgi:hypothetical protein
MKTVEWKKLSAREGFVAETAAFARGFIPITVKKSFTIMADPEDSESESTPNGIRLNSVPWTRPRK